MVGSRSRVANAMVQESVQLELLFKIRIHWNLFGVRTFDVSYDNGPAKSIDVDGANASLHRTMVFKSLKVKHFLL